MFYRSFVKYKKINLKNKNKIKQLKKIQNIT